jgi:MFS family permease
MLAAMASRLGVVRTVLRNASLRRIELAYLLWAFGGWSSWVAVIVYAYGRGGAAEAGLVAFVELAPALVLAPVVAALGDRYRRARVLFGTYAAQAALMTAAAIAIAAGSPALVVYGLATLTATTVTFSRPVHAALMPELVSSPEDLTAANVVSGMADSVGVLVGPLGAGFLVSLGGPAAVFAVAALGDFIGMTAVSPLARARRVAGAAAPNDRWSAVALGDGGADQRADPAAPGTPRPPSRPSAAMMVGDGLRAIAADRRLLAVIAIASWATFLVGALDILYAVLAIDLLHLDGSGVGFIGALGGIGAIAGSASGLVLVGRERLGIALGVSGFLFGFAIAAVSVTVAPIAVAVLIVCAGAGSGLTYVAAQTLIQRLAGDDVMSRVFGVLQGLMMGTTAIGALSVPLIIEVVGERAAFAVAGLSLPLVVLLAGRTMLRGGVLDPARLADLRLLRGVPMFAPLAAPVMERLASGVVRTSFPAGDVVMREGEAGDRFHVVVAGQLAVAVRGREVRRLGPGDGFGEIALLRDVPRTATVTAVSDVLLAAVDRGPFLDALTGQPRSRIIAGGVADARLATDAGES